MPWRRAERDGPADSSSRDTLAISHLEPGPQTWHAGGSAPRGAFVRSTWTFTDCPLRDAGRTSRRRLRWAFQRVLRFGAVTLTLLNASMPRARIPRREHGRSLRPARRGPRPSSEERSRFASYSLPMWIRLASSLSEVSPDDRGSTHGPRVGVSAIGGYVAGNTLFRQLPESNGSVVAS